MSQPPKYRSSSLASGTNSRMSGERPSVRLPRRMVPICVSEPIGLARPPRTASTPAMKVVATAPMPGINTPSLPRAGFMSTGFLVRGVINLPSFCLQPICPNRGRVGKRKRSARSTIAGIKKMVVSDDMESIEKLEVYDKNAELDGQNSFGVELAPSDSQGCAERRRG